MKRPASRTTNRNTVDCRRPAGSGSSPWRALADRQPCQVATLIGCLTFLVFLPAVAGGFIDWDDDRYVFDNPLVLGGLSPTGVWRACTEVVFFNWAPLTILSYQLDASLFGTGPWGFHFTNIVLHAIAAALLDLALVRLTGAAGRSAAAALLFALHPLRVESVAWIAERKDVLSVMFLMLALLAYDRYTRRPTVARYLAVALAMLGSLLAKSTLVMLPLLLLLIDVWPLGRVSGPAAPAAVVTGGDPRPRWPWWWLVIEKLPLLALAFVFGRITLATQAEAMASPIATSFLRAQLPNAILSWGWYVEKSFLPTGLHPACHHMGTDVSWPLVAAIAMTSIAVAGLAIMAGRATPAVPWGLAWFALALVPVLGFVQVGFQSHADRFTYIPHVGLAVAVAWGASDLIDRLRLPAWTAPAALVAACLACLVLTERQIAVWRTREALWSHVRVVDPGNPVALGKQAFALAGQGRLDEAEQAYLLGLRRADDPWIIAGLARVYHAKGDADQMCRYRDWAARVGPRDESVVSMLRDLPAGERHRARPVVDPRIVTLLEEGSVALNSRQLAAALDAFQAALAIDANCAAAHNLAGIACVGLDRHAAAKEHFQAAISLDPDSFGYLVNMARLESVLLEWPACEATCERALALKPDDPEVVNLLRRARAKIEAAP